VRSALDEAVLAEPSSAGPGEAELSLGLDHCMRRICCPASVRAGDSRRPSFGAVSHTPTGGGSTGRARLGPAAGRFRRSMKRPASTSGRASGRPHAREETIPADRQGGQKQAKQARPRPPGEQHAQAGGHGLAPWHPPDRPDVAGRGPGSGDNHQSLLSLLRSGWSRSLGSNTAALP